MTIIKLTNIVKVVKTRKFTSLDMLFRLLKHDIIKNFYGRNSGKAANPVTGGYLNVRHLILFCINNKLVRIIKQIFISA